MAGMGPTVLELELEAIDAEVDEVMGHLNVAHARLVRLVAQVLDGNRWAVPGVMTPEHWVQWHTGCTSARARLMVHIAERAHELPACMAVFERGELSVEQMGAVAARCPARHDAEMAQLAPNCSVAQIRHVSRRWHPTAPPATDPPAASEDHQHAEAPPADDDETPTPAPPQPPPVIDPAVAEGTAAWWFDDDGRFHLHLSAPTLDGALIANALDEARDALFLAGETDATVYDAVMEVVNRSLAAVGIASRADRFRVYAFMDTEGAWLHNGLRLPPALLDQILSDGNVRPVWTTGGIPVNVGRGSHTVPNHLRRLVYERDGARCRNCDSTVGLHVHHYRWWTDGGGTDLDNLGVHCSRCHRAIHRGDIVASGNPNLPPSDPDSLRFHRRDGSPIRSVRRFCPPVVPPSPGRWTRPTHERLVEYWIEFAHDDGTGPPTPPRRTRPRPTKNHQPA